MIDNEITEKFTLNDSSEQDKEFQLILPLDKPVVLYFKNIAEETGIPFHTLINMCLTQCVKEEKKLKFV